MQHIQDNNSLNHISDLKPQYLEVAVDFLAEFMNIYTLSLMMDIDNEISREEIEKREIGKFHEPDEKLISLYIQNLLIEPKIPISNDDAQKLEKNIFNTLSNQHIDNFEKEIEKFVISLRRKYLDELQHQKLTKKMEEIDLRTIQTSLLYGEQHLGVLSPPVRIDIKDWPSSLRIGEKGEVYKLAMSLQNKDTDLAKIIMEVNDNTEQALQEYLKIKTSNEKSFITKNVHKVRKSNNVQTLTKHQTFSGKEITHSTMRNTGVIQKLSSTTPAIKVNHVQRKQEKYQFTK